LNLTKTIKLLVFTVIGVVSLNSSYVMAQCDPITPVWNIDLSNNPDTVWDRKAEQRNGYCCDATGTDRCINFIVTLHPNAAGIYIGVRNPGPSGAMYFVFECDPDLKFIVNRDTACVDGPGPHSITICKPGNDNPIYTIASIAGAEISPPIVVTDACVDTIGVAGMIKSSIVWNSVLDADGGNTVGEWNSFLYNFSGVQTNLASDSLEVIPSGVYPEWIDYEVCGELAGFTCGGVAQSFCATTRVYFVSTFEAQILPENPSICFGGDPVTLTAYPTGGASPYSYIWNTGATTESIVVTSGNAGEYWVEVRDTMKCAGIRDTVQVLEFVVEIEANAGLNDTVCLSSPTVQLNGSVTGVTTGVWLNGLGTFSPNDSTLNAEYTFHPDEITQGFVDLYLVTTFTGVCPSDTDTVRISIISEPTLTMMGDVFLCADVTSLQISGTTSANGDILWITRGNGFFDDNEIDNPLYTFGSDDYLNESVYLLKQISNEYCEPILDSLLITFYPELIADAGSDILICQNEIAVLGGSPVAIGGSTPYAYNWSNGSTLTADNIANPTSNTTITTVYNLTVTDDNGCQAFDVVNVSVSEIPVVDAGSDRSICEGGETIIGGSPTASSGTTTIFTYNWSPSTELNDPTIANPTSSPTSNITYSLTVTDEFGCSATDEVEISVINVLYVDAGDDQSICDGGSAQIGGSPTAFGNATSYTYIWSPSASLDDASVANPISNASASTLYNLTVIDSNGCVDTDEVYVGVSEIPTVDAGNDRAICEGVTTQLGGSPTASSGTTTVFTYLWSPSAELDNANVSNPNASATATTTYTITVTDEFGCRATDEVTISVTNILYVDAGNDLFICEGTSVNIGGSPTASGNGTSYTYAWSNGQDLDADDVSNPVATPAGTTTYTVTVTDNNGCVGTDDIIVSITFFLSVDAGNDQTICDGGSVQIGGSPTVSGNATSFTYNWSNGSSLDADDISNPVSSAIIQTTYSLTVVDSNGCTGTDEVTVSVSEAPTVDAGNDRAICEGVTTQLGGSPTATSAVTTVFTYSWSPVEDLNNPSVSNPIASTTATITYIVTVTDEFGCSATDDVTISVTNVLYIDAGPDQAVCDGISVQIGGNPTASGNATSYTYIWSPSAELDDPTIANPLSSATSNTLYSLTVEDSNGCIAVDEVFVGVSNLPTVDAGLDRIICEGITTQLGGNPTASSPATSNFTYLWLPFEDLNDNSLANPTAATTVTTTYFLTVTDEFGCSSSDEVTVSVTNVLYVDAGQDVEICGGAIVILGGNPTASGDGTSYTYAWSNGQDLDADDISNPTALPTGTTIYTVTVTDNNGCVGTDEMLVSITFFLYVDAGPDQSICDGGSVQIGGSPTASGNATSYAYQWSPVNGIDDASISNPTTNTTITTVYTVTVIDSNGCELSDDVRIGVSVPPIVDAGLDRAICEGTTTTLGGNPTATSSQTSNFTYLWLPFEDLDDNNISNPIAATTITTTYFLTVTDEFGCTASDDVTVSVTNVLYVDAGDDQLICDGTSIQLGGNPTATGNATSYSYLWNNSQDLDANDISNPIATPSGTTTYTLTVTDSNGCVGTDDILISVTYFLYVDAGDDQSICDGGTAQIGGNPTADGNATSYVYQWSPTDGLDDATISNPTTNTTVTTAYSLTVSDSNGCELTDEVTVGVSVPPTVDAGNDRAICEGTTTVLGGNPTALSGTTTVFTYLWSNAPDLDDATVSNPVASTTITTAYEVTVTDEFGCSSTDEVTISITNVLNIDAGLDREICEGTSVVLGGSPTASGNGTSYTYVWSNGQDLDADDISNPTANTTATATYIVTVTDNNGCEGTDDVTISVTNVLYVDAGDDQSICDGVSVTIGGNPTASGNATSFTYAWSPSSSLDDASSANPNSSATTTTVYSLTVVDSNGCEAMDDVEIKVGDSPIANAGNDMGICENNSGILGGNPTGSGPGTSYTYIWSDETTLDDYTLANPTTSTTITTVYTVTVTNDAGCSAIDMVTVTLVPNPIADFETSLACIGETVNFTDLSSTTIGNIIGWSWDFANGSFANTSNPSTSYDDNLIYNVTLAIVTDSGCVDTVIKPITLYFLPELDFEAIGSCLEIGTNFIGEAISQDGEISYIEWNLGDGNGSSELTFNYLYDEAGDYLVTFLAETSHGCKDTVQQMITVVGTPIAAFTSTPDYVQPGQVVGFEDQSEGPQSWDWNFGDGSGTSIAQNPIYIYQDTGIFVPMLIVQNEYGCIDTAYGQVTVYLPPLVPTGFTPNGNGKNDILFVRGGPYSDLDFRIYNNWGELIFQTNDQSIGWDGNRNGIPQPVGVYVFTLSATSISGQKYKDASGDITLIR
jgi:gliding motility-associated-like protein